MKSRRLCRLLILTLGFALFSTLLEGCTYEYSLEMAKKWTKRMEFGDQYSVYRQRSIAIPANVDICVATALSHLNERQLQEYQLQDQQQQSTQLSSSQRSLSQQLLSNQLNEALLPYVASVQLLGIPQNTVKALNSAEKQRCDFLLYPQIVLNQDNVSSFVELDESDKEEYSVGLDRQWLQLALWDVNSRELADLSLIKSRNGFFTVFAHHPDDLMPTALAAYASELFVVRSYQ